MKEEPHIGDEHRQRSPPQKRRREDSESQPPASANRPGLHTFNGPQQAFNVPQQGSNVPRQVLNFPRQALTVPQQASNVPQQAFNVPQQAFNVPQQALNVLQQAFNVPQQVVPQNQAMVAAHDGDLMNNDPASSQDLVDTLQAERIVLSRTVNRLKNQIQEHLADSNAHAERIEFLETQSETLNLKLMRAERENETAQAKFDSDMKKRYETATNIFKKMARDKQAEVSGLQTALQASNGQRQRDVTALQLKHDQTVADHQARVAELQETIRRQEVLLQQTYNFEAQRQFAQRQVQGPRLVQVAQGQQTQPHRAHHQLAKRQQAQRWEIRRQLLEEIERQGEDLYQEAEVQNQEARAQNQKVEAQNQEVEAQNQEAQRQEDTSQEGTNQEDASQEGTPQDDASQEDIPQEAT